LIFRLAQHIYGQKLTRGDLLILSLALLVVLTCYAVFWGRSVYGSEASISVAGHYWSNVDLYQNRRIEVKGKIGISVLEVKDGKIRFVSSPCDTKQCVHHGWIQHSGEIIACVPNTVSVRILGPDPRFDTMNF